MFCIYCRSPFNESIETICSGCGRELYKNDTRVSSESYTEAQEIPATDTPLPAPAIDIPLPALPHNCVHCGAEFPVGCTICGERVFGEDISVPPEGWMVCGKCHLSFWVICPECEKTQETTEDEPDKPAEEEPEAEPPEEEPEPEPQQPEPEPQQPEPGPPQMEPPMYQHPVGLMHNCNRCAVPFPVACYHCGVQSTDPAVPPEGWLVCNGCQQTYWVVCPHCQSTQQQEQPSEPSPQPESPAEAGQNVRGGLGNAGRPDEPYVPGSQTESQTDQQPPTSGSGSSGQTPGSGVNTGGQLWNPQTKSPPYEHRRPEHLRGNPQPRPPQYPPYQTLDDYGEKPKKKKPGKLVLGLLCVAAIGITIIFGPWDIIPPFGGGGGGGSSSSSTYYTPNASWEGNRGASVQMRANETLIFWGRTFVKVNNRTGEAETHRLNESAVISMDARQPAFFADDYVYFIGQSGREIAQLTRLNIKTYELEQENKAFSAEDNYPFNLVSGIYYDGAYIYVSRSPDENDVQYLEKYDPKKFEVVEKYDIGDSYGGNGMVWQDKFYYYDRVFNEEKSSVGFSHYNDIYWVLDLKTGSKSMVNPTADHSIEYLCADNNALYYLQREFATFDVSTGEVVVTRHRPSAVITVNDGVHSAIFGYENLKGHYEEYIGFGYEGFSGVLEADKYYYEGIEEIFLDGDWMYAFITGRCLDEHGYEGGFTHLLRFTTDGKSIERINFSGGDWGDAPYHQIAVSGEWIVDNGMRWQIKDGKLIRNEAGPLNEPVPVDKLK